MNEQYYCLHLDDPAAPSFCSFGKSFFGNEHELLTAMDGMENAEECPDTVRGVRAFFNGCQSATHIVAYSAKGLLEIGRAADGHFLLNNLLYVVEYVFDSLTGVDADILDPEKLIFDGICEEVFADG